MSVVLLIMIVILLTFVVIWKKHHYRSGEYNFYIISPASTPFTSETKCVHVCTLYNVILYVSL